MNKINNDRLRLYLQAETAVLAGQSYTIGNRTLTRANLATIRAAIDDLVAAGATLDDTDTSGHAGNARRVVLMD
ncbi:DUF6148 family protein [Acidaminococcus intestini]